MTDEAKECRNAYNREYRKNNEEKLKQYHKEWRKNNKDKTREYHKKYYEKNKNIIKEKRKENYEKNKGKIREYYRGYYEKNKEKVYGVNTKYRKKDSVLGFCVRLEGEDSKKFLKLLEIKRIPRSQFIREAIEKFIKDNEDILTDRTLDIIEKLKEIENEHN